MQVMSKVDVATGRYFVDIILTNIEVTKLADGKVVTTELPEINVQIVGYGNRRLMMADESCETHGVQNCPACSGNKADRLDRPDREAIKEILRIYVLGICKTKCIHPSWHHDNACLYCLADQILSLIDPEASTEINLLAQGIATVLLAEWLAIEHGETRLQATKYGEEAQELADYLYTIGYRLVNTTKWLDPEAIKRQVAEEICSKCTAWDWIQKHAYHDENLETNPD